MHIELLKHSFKAITYRFQKAINNSKADFGEFKISDHTRTPNEIINHMYDLAVKTGTMIREGHFNCPAPLQLSFDEEVHRFLKTIKDLETIIEENKPGLELSKKLLQGPIMDITTHVGQLAILNGLNGNKIPKESYFDAGLD